MGLASTNKDRMRYADFSSQGLFDLLKKYKISFIKVQGHAGVYLNELADKLARKGVEELS